MSIFDSVKKVWKNDSSVSLGLFVVIVQLFMLVNPSVFFGAEKAEHFRMIILIYLVFMTVGFALPDLRLKLFSVSLKRAFPKMLFFGVVTYIATLFLAVFLVNVKFAPLLDFSVIGFGIVMLDSFIVAVAEENVFRIILPYFLSDFSSNSLFSLFHWQVYSTNVLALFMMFLLGYVWTFLKRMYSPNDGVANIGSHAGWNIATKIFQEARGVSA